MQKIKAGAGRRWWTSKRRQRLLAQFHQSQLTRSVFDRENGVGLSTLNRWLRLDRDAVHKKVKFPEVRMRSSVSKWPVEVVSPQGWIVRLQNGSETKSLPELLRALPF